MCSADIFNESDNFHYFYKSTISGNISVEIFVNSFTGTNLHRYAKGGLMLRNSLDANSRHFSCYVTADNTVNNQWRSNDGKSTNQHGISIGTKTTWLKITKIGNMFRCYYKTGNDWTQIGYSQTLDFPDIFYYGIAVSPHVNGNIVELKGTSFVDSSALTSNLTFKNDNKISISVTDVSASSY